MPIAVRPNTTVVTVMTDALTKNNIPAENVSAYSLFNVTDAGGMPWRAVKGAPLTAI